MILETNMKLKHQIILLLTLLLIPSVVSALPYTYEIGDITVVSGMDYFPIEIYIFFMLFGIVCMILGFVTRFNWLFELLAFMFFIICAFGTPLAATYTADISYNASNISEYIVTPIVNTVLPTFFVWLCYGLAMISFFTFFIFLFKTIMMWMDDKTDKPYGDEFLR